MAKKPVGSVDIKKNNLDLDENIDDYVTEFFEEYKPAYSRNRSYDFVHKIFADYLTESYAEYDDYDGKLTSEWMDCLALNLYAFLGSWGMFRKGFLRENNYTCLVNVCELICKTKCDENGRLIRKYAWLVDIDPFDRKLLEEGPARDKYIEDMSGLIKEMKKIFKSDKICRQDGLSHEASNMLVTKILLATLGCIPAYDTFATNSLKKLGHRKSPTNGGLGDLLDFVKDHEDAIQEAMFTGEYDREKTYNGDMDVCYPVMKYVDMILWEYGKDKKKKS